MRKILGYPLSIDWKAKESQTLELPIHGAIPLTVELVDGSYVLYVEHEYSTEASTKLRKVVVFRAGQPLNFYTTSKDYNYLGTVVNGPWAWHVYISIY